MIDLLIVKKIKKKQHIGRYGLLISYQTMPSIVQNMFAIKLILYKMTLAIQN